MYLSRLTLNPRSTAFIRDRQNVHDMHRTIMSGFPDTGVSEVFRQTHAVLWRIDETPAAIVQYVQSKTEPNWSRHTHLAEESKPRPLQPLLDYVAPGRSFVFRLTANPTRYTSPDGNPDNRKRVFIKEERDQIDWLLRTSERHGFVIPATQGSTADVVTTPLKTLTGTKNRQKVTIRPVRFDGRLLVTDPDSFKDTIINGVGRAKAYGCGLLSLARPR